MSASFKDEEGEIFHTYSTYEQGLDMLNGTVNYLDLTPRGWQEEEGSGGGGGFMMGMGGDNGPKCV